MTSMDEHGTSGISQKGHDVAGKAAEGAQELAGQAREQVRAGTDQAGERLRAQVDSQSTRAGEGVASLGDATRRVGEQLRGEGKDGPARMADAAAERMERLGGYLQRTSGDDLLRDVERFGRRQPVALAAGGMVAGLLAARFLKASSHDRYRSAPSRAQMPPTSRADMPAGAVPQPPRPDSAIEYPAASGL